MGLLSLGTGVAIGYVIGTKTGRKTFDASFDNVRKNAEETWNRPDVQEFVEKTTESTYQLRQDLADGAKRAVAVASDAVKRAEQKVNEATDEFVSPETETTYDGDVVSDPAQSTESSGADWSNEGGSDPRT
ncbi:hypothetical protein [Garicola koreensis]|uniref:ElaB/YqjD/DUF883 family membrane-anchored ribosome-binding protein n=1 Tax=Garicola koreensis TaxID=1262554 RepID=A0A7W5XLF9_9MICC|nr:hypothetical protein [Garicola koreensis]MBB3668090.1 ElaB/YqjD/DUF883 family membrane-anchored ribosome-binding protein [Garicola koreensis]